MTSARLTHYQALLLNIPHIPTPHTLGTYSVLHEHSLLPDSDEEIIYECSEVLLRVQGPRPDLTSPHWPWPGLEAEDFIVSWSFIHHGLRYVGQQW